MKPEVIKKALNDTIQDSHLPLHATHAFIFMFC